MTLRPTPGDIELFSRFIDVRDSAHLAGHRDKPFIHQEFNNGESIVFGPGRTGDMPVPTLAVGRLRNLGLFRVIDERHRGYTFDLVDDFRDRIEEMKVVLGTPSRMGELEAAAGQAEAAVKEAEASKREIEARQAAFVAERAKRRAAFARRVGRGFLWASRVGLAILYVAIMVIAGYFVSSNLPLALIVGVVGVFVVLTAIDWLLHIDGFALAARVEAWAIARTTHWLESFEADAS